LTRSSQTEIRYELLAHSDRVEEIAPAWNDLLDRSPCNRAFSSPVWFMVTCRVQQFFQPRVAIAWRNDCLAGVLPVALDTAQRAVGFPNSMSNYNDVVAAAGDHEIVRGLVEYVRKALCPGIALTLRWLRQESNCIRAIERFEKEQDYMFLRLDGGWEGYLASRSRNFRKSVSQALRRAYEADLFVRQLDPREFDPEALPELFLRLHLGRFGEKSAFRVASPNWQFLLQALPTLFRDGRIIAFGLFNAHSCIGIDLSMVGAASLCTWNGGYPKEAERWSPGKLLIVAGIRKAINMGFREYDLLRGAQEWKKHWATNTRAVGRLDYPA